MAVKGHEPVVIDQFNGLWDRDDRDSVPQDHFIEANNIRHVGTSGFGTRYGVGVSQDVAVPLSNVRRVYNYPTQTGNTLIVLVLNSSGVGEIYHVVDSTTVHGPILTIDGMVDFAFLPYAGRGYISPIGYYEITGITDEPINIEKGLEDDFVYVYAGNGTAARKAAGDPLSGSIVIANGAAGHTDSGFKLFAFVVETTSGYLTAPGAITGFTTSSNLSVSFSSIPVSADPAALRKHLVATKTISDYNGNTTGYQFYFVPNATVDNADTTLPNISFFDAELLEDASYLLDNFEEIPAGAVLTLYHNRMVVAATFDDISVGYVSAIGEPEAINQVSGLFIVPPDGNPITNAQELRDVLYVFKRNRTVSFVDNGDEPSSWPLTFIDNALGASLHGIATVLDSGSASVDVLIIANYKGINLFNGTYINPELSWKIQNYWINQDQNLFRLIQLVNDPVNQQLLCVMPDQSVLSGAYMNGMTAKTIKWEPWTFPRGINTIAIVNVSDIILGMDL